MQHLLFSMVGTETQKRTKITSPQPLMRTTVKGIPHITTTWNIRIIYFDGHNCGIPGVFPTLQLHRISKRNTSTCHSSYIALLKHETLTTAKGRNCMWYSHFNEMYSQLSISIPGISQPTNKPKQFRHKHIDTTTHHCHSY